MARFEAHLLAAARDAANAPCENPPAPRSAYKETYNYALAHVGLEYRFTREFSTIAAYSYDYSLDDFEDEWNARLDFKFRF